MRNSRMAAPMSLSLAVATIIPLAISAQSPVADAFKSNAARAGRILTAAAETMPAADYGFKPTPAQMTFGNVVVHLAEGNDMLCGTIGGSKAPERSAVTETSSKEVLVARLKETFAFCDQALANLDDSHLADSLPMFGRSFTRAGVMTIATGDWADHYSQAAIYLRLKGQLPPTAKRP